MHARPRSERAWLMTLTLGCALGLVGVLAMGGCAAPVTEEVPPPPAPDLERHESGLSVTVGTHRATGKMSCRIFPAGTITYQVSTMVYISGTTVPGSWLMQLNKDPNAGVGSVTIDMILSWPLESRDNGAVIYNVAGTTAYMHRIRSDGAFDYFRDEDVPIYGMQFLQADADHPYGQVALGLYPKGNSDPLKGECLDAVGVYLTIQP